jgi:hypothetical protein
MLIHHVPTVAGFYLVNSIQFQSQSLWRWSGTDPEVGAGGSAPFAKKIEINREILNTSD